ncbi:small-subunit processome [Haematococcus lacustris]
MSMLQAVVGSKAAAAPDGSSGQPSTASKRKAKQADAQATVLTEAYPEAEFNLNPGAASAGLSASGELSVADLIKGLGNEGRRKLAPAARKMLEKMAAGAKAVAAPLPRTIKERTERRAGYETTSKEVSKWQPLVKANREAPTLRFTAARDEVPHVNTTAALVAQHVPEGDMEAEVAALLQAAGAATTKAVAEAEQALSLKALSVEEAAERRERLAKMRSLLFYHELKAKRMKAIKSKEFHRKAAKAAKRKGQRDGLGQGMEEGGEREAQEAQEFERAKERLTLKHRNTSRWARRALKRGATILDPGTKAAVAEQLQLGEALKRKIEGQAGSDEEDSGSSSSGEDEGEARGQAGGSKGSKARAAALEVLQGSDPAHPAQPATKGLLSLPFMARALERQRLEAEQQARALLAELDEEGGELDAAGTGSGPLGSSAAHGGTGLGPGVTGAMGRLRFGWTTSGVRRR